MRAGDDRHRVALAAGVIETAAARSSPADVGHALAERCAETAGRLELVLSWLQTVTATLELEAPPGTFPVARCAWCGHVYAAERDQ